MSKNITIILLIVIVVLLIIGGVLGFFLIRGNNQEVKVKKIPTFNLTLEDMYSNVKDSKKILKTNITIETINEKTFKNIDEKQFLIRNEVNIILRSKDEEALAGKEGQLNLQQELKESIINLFNDENITNIYFNDFIIQ